MITSTRFALALTLFAAPFAFAQTADDAVNTSVGGLSGQEGLNATIWVQTAAEARIAAIQAYALATRQLDVALQDKNWTAAVEQRPNYQQLPPAIILDVDETVLDNSPYQARLVRDDATFTGQSWEAWVSEANAKAIAGAPEFLRYAARKGVAIFYVTNRGKSEEAATRENLKRLGLPLATNVDAVLMNGEQPHWTSDKTSRRAFIAHFFRVLLLVGDDLNDFVPAKPMSRARRLELVAQYQNYWGQKWILLSNPLYGSWEGALLDYRSDLSRQEIFARKYGALEPRETVAPVAASPDAAGATR